MVVEIETGWCDVCKAWRTLMRTTERPPLHGMLAVLTLGIWPIICRITGLNQGHERWRCDACGSDYVFPGEEKVAEGEAYYQQRIVAASPTHFCTRCGEALPNTAAFCNRCGHPVVGGSTDL